jgi:N-acetylmuramoyl-L-alanine amidase
MVASHRSALLIFAALSATSVAPAQAGPSSEALVPQDSLQVASVTIPERLPSVGEEVTPEAQVPQTPDQAAPDATAPVATIDRNEDLPNLVAELRSPDPGSHEVECLAAGIYFESKSEPLSGQLAVGQVIANRVKSHRFADSYCGVLFQRGQFSFVHGHSWGHISPSDRQWETAVAIAKIVDGHLKDSVAGNALYFHARRVHPGWHFQQVASIGNHVFFR